ncbi:peptide chain release factor 1 [Candidatus Aquarickettsia rohweri]|uniref:Peptide chain release factor 1 n=1 Tax=Candidatus Aquarickettsia rohweri TaxID=2602574 RepID=A0A3R9ZKV2_9RICK|nr:peptide chain release factor 1 [Candidatus Aquarickettsia rohweri]MSO14115.1 Peptide chain release factor 1 [Rickettsiales endosymbiont of Trichoplax sp. H2]RST71303.1 peptide chain release factor 1 [Candidatus Aquarickettsia rohweri]
MAFEDRLKNIIKKYNSLNDKLSDPSKISSQDFAKIAKEHSDLSEINKHATKYLENLELLNEAEELLKTSEEKELKDLALEQKKESKLNLESLKETLKIMLIPKDIADEKGAIIEIRAGTGGDEAALFASTLFRMYQKYAENRNWKFEILSVSGIVLEGCKEAMASISGKGVYKRLKFESGVHRVQRVPTTESSGRIHTSAATVAVLPEAEDIDLKINDKDLRIDSYRSSGAGGQHVNTTDSAIRITHIPTGLVVVQSEKSQHQNKAKALKILKSKLYDIEREKQNKEISDLRKVQVGSGDRSERIRTYNFPQNRITDHRINLTTYNLQEAIQESNIDQFIDALIADDQAKKISQDDNDE